MGWSPWDKTAPIPKPDASTTTLKGQGKSVKAGTDAEHNFCLRSSKLSGCISPHCQLSFLRSYRSSYGADILYELPVKNEARPKRLRFSLILDG